MGLAAAVNVPGEVLSNIVVPARGYLPAMELSEGQVMRVIDVEGKQVGDIVLYSRGLGDPLSCSNTTLLNGTWRITRGHGLYSKRCRRLATITADTVGLHFFGGGFCSAELDACRYGVTGTVNCADNLAAALSAYGVTRDELEHDSCFSVFMNLTYQPDGSYAIAEPTTSPGDYLDIRADMDLVVAMSNCPQERNPCNAFKPTDLRVIVYRPGDDWRGPGQDFGQSVSKSRQ